MDKNFRDDVMRFKVVNEQINKQKPGLYILKQNEKRVKRFEVEEREDLSEEQKLFEGIG